MYPRMFSAIKKRGLIPDINWQVVVDSSLVKLKKPNPKIYKLAEEKCGFKGNEIFLLKTLKIILMTLNFLVGKLSYMTRPIQKSRVKT